MADGEQERPLECYRPAWCPHVQGTYRRAFDADGKPEAIWVELSCDACGDRHRARCESGAPRQWVLRYATAHVHRDVMAVPMKEKTR